MSEEFIPRDTPIYCFVANNEKDLDRARQTRDVWTKRWGYTNFIIQERVDTYTYLNTIHPQWSNIFTNKEIYLANTSIHNRGADFIYLIEKLKTKNQQSIVIQSNTILTNDIPKHYLNNHISIFSLNKQRNFDIRNGLMVSSVWCKAFFNYIKIHMGNKTKSNILTELNDQRYSMLNHPLVDLEFYIKDCKTNFEELKEKTQEEMYGTFV